MCEKYAFLRNTSPTLQGCQTCEYNEREASGLQPLGCCPNSVRNDPRIAVSPEIILIDWGEHQVEGVDVEVLTTEGERDKCGGGAWDEVARLAVALRSGDLDVDGFGISLWNIEEGATGVENGCATFESEILVVNGHCGETSLPESILVDVRHGDEGLGVELGLVKASGRNLAVVETIGKPGNFVRSDGFLDQPLFRKRLDWGQDLRYGRKGGLG